MPVYMPNLGLDKIQIRQSKEQFR